MKMHQALDIVARRYVPGAVAYFGKMRPDPWQQAHDDLEKIAGILDEATITPVLERFVDRCTELLERYLTESNPPKSPSPVDYFVGGDDNARAHLSRKLKRCFHCDAREALKIVPLKNGSLEVILACQGCLARKGA